MRSQAIVASVVIVILLGTAVAEAAPPLPSSFHGTVKGNNGNNVPEGTTVSAWINGVKYAETESQMDAGDSVYAIDVPGDDPETTEVVEGGVEGNTVVFKVGDSTAGQTGTWHTGTDVELNLEAPPTTVILSSFTARSDATVPTEFTSRSLLALGAAGLIALLAASAILVKDATMRRNRAILIAILALTFSLPLVTGVEAVPPLPSSFYGTVKLDKANMPDGTIVSAWIRGVKYTETQTVTYQGDSVYAIRVPGDDLESPEIEGGAEGDTVIFMVGEAAAIETGTWHSGTDVELNLTACTLFGDLDCSCLVDVADIMEVASRWRCECWDSCYDPRYDLDHDCIITIVDIMKVAAHWRETCE